MKKIVITLLLILSLATLAFAWLSFTQSGKRFSSLHLSKKEEKKTPASSVAVKLKSRALQAKNFAQQNKYNTSYCFLIDMSMPSGQNRFFVYDLQKDSVLKNGLVTHGRCNENWLEGRRYGNTVGCGCTSLGKYKIGGSYYGKFGLAFKLYGLDKTNDKAYQRYVVLHAHECVPATGVQNEICQSDGCPTVSPQFLKELQPMISNAGKPMLLWIFD